MPGDIKLVGEICMFDCDIFGGFVNGFVLTWVGAMPIDAINVELYGLSDSFGIPVKLLDLGSFVFL